jgi:hypothetical protein
MMKKAIFGVLLLLATTGRAGAQSQVPDSCLTLWQNVYCQYCPDSIVENSDSAMVDTCYGSEGYHAPYYFLRFGWAFVFKYDILPLDSVSADSILIVNWDAIDTSYVATRDSFQKMAIKYGGVHFQKFYPNVSDSTIGGEARFFGMILGSYYSADTVLQDLENVPLVTEARYSFPSVESRVTQSQNTAGIKILYIDPYHVRFSGVEENEPYILFDIIGREIGEGWIDGSGVIDLSAFNPGMYFIRIGNYTYSIFR